MCCRSYVAAISFTGEPLRTERIYVGQAKAAHCRKMTRRFGAVINASIHCGLDVLIVKTV